MRKLAQYWKGILGFITPGVVAFGVAVTEGSDGGETVTQTEWVGIVVAMLVTGGLVTAKRNGVSGDPTTSTPQVDP
jgi:hypothetical protein